MASRQIRRVRTGSGAVAVQVITRQGREVLDVQHLGSAHSDGELELLMVAAREQLSPGQQELDLDGVERSAARMDDVADWTAKHGPAPVEGEDVGAGPVQEALVEITAEAGVEETGQDPEGRRPAARRPSGKGRVVATSSKLLWDVLAGAYVDLGFDTALGDGAFKAMVLARIIEPASKEQTPRVLADHGLPSPVVRTLFRALSRCFERDYRGRLASAAAGHSARVRGRSNLLLYDSTTLHFEAEHEDELRKVGMSKERRVDPQVQVGLLVDPAGFPLEVHLFAGNKAETTTLIPVLQQFQRRHGVTDMVVVADAGMLSAGNLNALEDAGFSFIVGSRITTAPYDLAEHFNRYGDYFDDGQILESSREMGTGSNKRHRRVVYQWRFKRHQRDNRTINKQVERAEKAIATGNVKRDRFVKVTGASSELNQATVDRARQLSGLKGYVTNLDIEAIAGAGVISAYHDLFEVERSFRMTKSDLRARPVFHHLEDSIEAHLTVVFAALAVSRHLQEVTGYSIAKIVRTLRPIRTATIEIAGQQLDFDSDPTDDARHIINAVGRRH